jgi:hypothetical protein
LNIPFSLTQGDLVQEALAVTFAKDQIQALKIPVKVPLGGGRYTELTVSALLSLLFIELRLYQWNLFFCFLLSDWFFFPGF